MIFSSLSLEGVNLEGMKMEGFCKITILPFHFFYFGLESFRNSLNKKIVIWMGVTWW
jgi:uncharacterized Fe-S cluster-containing radical SAM superfamily protein